MSENIKTESLVFDEGGARLASHKADRNIHQDSAFIKGARHQHSIDKAAHDKIVAELQDRLEKEEASCGQLIDERDFRENQINEIASLLGDNREWSSANDRGDNCLESIEALQSELTELRSAIDEVKKALGFYADSNNWLGFNEEQGFVWSNEFCPDGQDYENLEGTCMVAGKLARQALASIEKRGKGG